VCNVGLQLDKNSANILPFLALREIFLANPNTAIALALEPDSLPNAITSLLHPRCAASVQEYKDGIAYALKQFDLPNVVQYIDAGNGNWLGWDPNVGKHPSSRRFR
jgi:cellulose 1,4-beta-cellobiosidase